jgi:hypothetical protein
LGALTSSPQTTASKRSRPRVSRATSTSGRAVEVTSAVGTPARRTASSSASAPGRHSRPDTNSSATRFSSQAAPSVGSWSLVVRPRSASRIAIELAMSEPTIALRAASDSVPP